ncbi:TolB-like translocation protein [Frankia sp. CiP1_Cm_nod1]|uniref:TolB-like translocation protein n=1 Tax=Frankia sp. CiP1_Cm_nod1 TaxID=2897160 RepID=UPI002024BB8E
MADPARARGRPPGPPRPAAPTAPGKRGGRGGRGTSGRPGAGRKPDATASTGRRRRLFVFVALLVVCVLLAGSYGLYVAHRDATDPRRSGSPAGTAGTAPLTGEPKIVFRSTARDSSYGRVAMVPLNSPAGPREVTSLTCERVDIAGDTGLCLGAERGVVTTYKAYLFGPDLRPVHSFRVAGEPSRARLSRDGHLAAVTVFVSGHAYAGPAFSTATTLYDVRKQRELGSLEQFAIFRDGQRINPADQNFWGVTFASDDDTFYATFATGGTTYLVRGSVRARQVHTLTTNVECPSLSPDGTRIAFKQRVAADGGPVRWRATVLDLKTMRRTELADQRSVDDQIAWFDNDTVVYGLPRDGSAASITDTWAEPADGSGAPRILVPQAWSPALFR